MTNVTLLTAKFQANYLLISYLGNQAKELFIKSALPLEILGKIWALVSSGSFSISQDMFIIAMFLITKLKMGQIKSVPDKIPSSLLGQVSLSTKHDANADVDKLTSEINVNITKPSKEDAAKYEAYFISLDKLKNGYLTGTRNFFPKRRNGKL